jgi:Spy/CpxP family protein refolding chaperone
METAMKRTTKLAAAVGLALGLGTAAVFAQPYGMMGGGPGMMGGGGGMMMGGGWGYNVEDRLAAQKAALKITPQQERAWTAYADVAKKQFDAMRTQREAMWKSAPASSAERYELHSKLMAQRAQEHEKLSAAYKELYSALTPEQRTLADQGGGYGYGPRGPGGRWR